MVTPISSHAHIDIPLTVNIIRDIPIYENNEPLIDLREQKIISYDENFLLENHSCTLIRKTVYEKLCEAQKMLPSNIHLQVSVGLRSLKVQSKMFDELQKQLKEKFPYLSERDLYLETSKFVAPVKTWEGIANIPPHSTGGAIDVVLINDKGSFIEMGINPNDPYDENFIRSDSCVISCTARENRSLMAQALSNVGFVNYEGEFWHWSYGDRRWAFVKGVPYAIYGPIAE